MHENMDTFVINKQYEIKHIDIYCNKSIYYNSYIKQYFRQYYNCIDNTNRIKEEALSYIYNSKI